MAYKAIDVTSAKANLQEGPIWWKEGALEEEITLGFIPTAEEGWFQLGEGGTDGVESAQSADGTDKQVWSKNMGTTYGNYKDILTVNMASATDTDMLGAVLGSDAITTVTGGKKIQFGSKQPKVGTWLIKMTTDDGRPWDYVVPRGQVDPNISRTMADEGIVVVAAAVTALPDNEGNTHYELMGDNDTTAPPVDPEA